MSDPVFTSNGDMVIVEGDVVLLSLRGGPKMTTSVHRTREQARELALALAKVAGPEEPHEDYLEKHQQDAEDNALDAEEKGLPK